jgi:predicted amidohydrolase YtcJ
VAQAFAARDGRLVEVGATDEILWLREDGCALTDLGGRCVIPGFVDPHNHFSLGVLDAFWADVTGATSVEEIQRALAEAARRTPEGLWVRARGYDHARLAGKRHPTRADLDAVVPDRPALLLHYSHHQGVANSPGLAAGGIARATPDPRGGEIGRDRSGEPNGLLFERALSVVETCSRQGWEARFVEAAPAAALHYASHGITAIQDAAVTPAMALRYAEARARGGLALTVAEAMVGSRGWFERPDDAAPGEWLKLFVDGGYRCAMRLRRDGETRTSGFLFYERDELARLLVDAWRAGRRVVCHAIGNLGVETAVGAIEDALGWDPGGRERVRVDHAMFLTRELIARLSDLGVWIVAQPSFLHDSGGASPSTDLLLRPFRSVVAAGARQAFSSDFPCGSLAPLAGIHAAVTRRSRAGELADPGEAVTARQALEAYTLGAAAAAGMAGERGSLEAGKRADFVVLSANPLECPAGALASLEVVETWVAGERIHRAEEGFHSIDRPVA